MNNSPEFAELRSLVATRTRRLIVWCGSGLSAPAGIPTWIPLQRRLESQLADKLATLDISEPQKEGKLRSIKQENRPWVAFERLQNELGITSFRAGVKLALSKAASVEVPTNYGAIWKLKPAGVINCNLDRLASRAYFESGGAAVIEFKGKEIGTYTYTLDNKRPFICNIHGVEEDVDSWVFTQQDLRELAASEAYKTYIASAASTAAILFLGITADDLAVGGHLERLSGIGVKTQPHFWITDRRDAATDAWAEKNGILVVRYKPTTASHPELAGLLEELVGYIQPEEDSPPPVALDFDFGMPPIEPAATLVTRSAEHIRSVLNAHAAALLKEGSAEAIAAYESFSKEYDRAIHAAWYTSTDSGENEFLGLTLQEEVARGAFGVVFRAIDSDGKEVAVKLLHAEIRKKRELLDAFRRGARSMRILGEKEIPGIVRFRAASEIPATLIMEWLDGQNLNQIVETGKLVEWDHILSIACQLTNIISSAHSISERVLHRDIRPPNVMVSGYWEGEEILVRVLDFDLSWHRGSVEKSVIFGSQLSGYLAPEQVQRRVGVSTQHASVDSYGLGMTLFYLVSGRNPMPGEHAQAAWAENLRNACQRPRGAKWQSIPARINRLILASTQEHQELRWDVSQIRSELNVLQEANISENSVVSPEFWAEELAARCSLLNGYSWNDSDFSVEKDFGTGLAVRIRGNETTQTVKLEIVRVSIGSDDRVRLVDSIYRARDNVTRALADGGWDVTSEVGHGMLTVNGVIEDSSISQHAARLVDSIRRACERMVFT